MGKRARAAKASLAAAFIAAGGASASQARAAEPASDASVEGIVSSYFGQLGLQDDFAQFIKLNSPFLNFLKWYKEQPADAIRGVDEFSAFNKVAPPPINRDTAAV
jgi:hypothetical protein